MPVKNKSNELKITRLYDAPVQVVWEAWTDPEQTAQWWGPRGFTLTTHSKDLRPGGHWKYTMHGPDGTDWPNHTIYYEVEEHKKLVYDHGGSDDKPPMFRVTVEFSEVGGKTKMEMVMTLPTPEEAEATAKFIKQAGGNATWDRLAEYLDKERRNKESFVINRSFDAPIETVFEMWANPEHLAKWLPPGGFDMQFIKVDIRTGGESFYCMSNSSGMKMYGRAHYIEVDKPNRLMYTQQFADENGNPSRHPMAPTWPETMLTTITFSAEGPDQTRVTVHAECHGDVSAEELATWINGRAGMTGGWTASLDKLEEYLLASTKR